MYENPYTAPQEEPLDRHEVDASSQRRYESLGQRFLSVALLLVVLTGPLWLATIGAVFSRGWSPAVANSAVSAAIMVWLAAAGWLIVRVIRRIRSKSAPAQFPDTQATPRMGPSKANSVTPRKSTKKWTA